jgi:hypothetical protein
VTPLCRCGWRGRILLAVCGWVEVMGNVQVFKSREKNNVIKYLVDYSIVKGNGQLVD